MIRSTSCIVNVAVNPLSTDSSCMSCMIIDIFSVLRSLSKNGHVKIFYIVLINKHQDILKSVCSLIRNHDHNPTIIQHAEMEYLLPHCIHILFI